MKLFYVSMPYLDFGIGDAGNEWTYVVEASDEDAVRAVVSNTVYAAGLVNIREVKGISISSLAAKLHKRYPPRDEIELRDITPEEMDRITREFLENT